MPAKNSITGDLIQSRVTTDKYAENYDAIFKKSEPKSVKPTNDSSAKSSKPPQTQQNQ